MKEATVNKNTDASTDISNAIPFAFAQRKVRIMRPENSDGKSDQNRVMKIMRYNEIQILLK